jgi:hypothetical protein
LTKLVKNPENTDSLLPDGSVFEILQILENHASSKAVTISTLRLLKSACRDEKILKDLEKHNALDSLLVALNNHPIDVEVKQLVGEIMGLLNANEKLQSFKVQYLDTAKDFDSENEESCLALKKANIHLANLLISQHSKPESPEVLEINKKIIESLEVTFPLCIEGGQEILATELLLISRLSNEGEQTKALIRESKISQLLIDDVIVNHEILNPDNGNIPVFALEAAHSMIGTLQRSSISFDAEGKNYETVFMNKKFVIFFKIK